MEENLEIMLSKQNNNDTEISIKSNVENLELYSDAYPFRLPLRIKNFENDSDYKKFIKSCEKLIRGSIEYKAWRNYIVDVLGINTCMITNERMDEVTVEVHHHIPSLYTITKAILNEKIEKEEEFSTFDICIKVIELHYSNKIGYTTLIKSLHEKFHNGFLHIPINFVRGDYKYFLSKYLQYLDEEDIDVINSRLTVTESNCGWSRDIYPIEEIKNEEKI